MKILEPIQVGKITLKNRIMFPPLTTGYEERDGSIGARSLNFYTRLAEGGVGYIVVGDVAPVNTASPTPKLFDDRQIPTFKKLADNLHAHGAKLGLQLFHPEYDVPGVGRMIVGSMMALKAAEEAKAAGDMATFGAKMAEAGKIRQEAYAKLHHDMQHFVTEASVEQLQEIIKAIGQSARRAQEAGVDVIEVHGDRIVGSLCSTILNHRTDEYGGSFENRIRFAIELVREIKKNAPDIVIDYKLPVVTVQPDGSLMGKGGMILEECVELSKILEKEGVDMIHVAQANHTGNMNDTIPAMGTRPYGFMLEETKAVKAVVSIPVSTVGRLTTVGAAETLLEQGVCDIVAYGRSLLADPDIANKLTSGKAEEIRRCIMCNKGCTDAIGGRAFVSCVLNAENGHEYERVITPAENPRTIAVVGGGVAGLEAARVLALKGHSVELYEKSARLGGQLNIASVPPRKEEMNRILNYYEAAIRPLDVKVYLNREFTKEDAKKYDTIINAVGAHNLVPRIPGIENVNVVNSWDVLANKEIVFGNVAVCGGGLVGVETAEYLAQKGYKVTIIEMQDKIAKEESATVMPTLMKDLTDHNVVIKTNARIKRFENNAVVVDLLPPPAPQAPGRPGAPVAPAAPVEPIGEETIYCDFIVNALASAKNVLDLGECEANVIAVGDCAGDRPSNINHAIESAYDAANSVK